MSDQPTASVCPSCSKEGSGNFCSYCGERMLHNKQDLRFTHFLKEAYHEQFNLDSKFLRTLKYLFLRPGFLTLELLKGKRNVYIKPFRLYVTMVVLHFLLFSSIPSGDIFNVDRFPAMKLAPGLQQVIKEQEIESKRAHDEFAFELSKKIKDNLSVVLYFVVFLAAAFLKFLYPSFNRYYVEHLYFLFHVFSFAMARNMLMIPFIMLDLIPITVVLVIGSQLIYTFLAMKRVYPQNNLITAIKLFALLAGVVAMFYISLHLCVYLALEQIL